jgi:hypothetical protein
MLKQMIASPISVVEPVISSMRTSRAKLEALRTVMEISCASHRRKKFLFLRRVRNPPFRGVMAITRSPCFYSFDTSGLYNQSTSARNAPYIEYIRSAW